MLPNLDQKPLLKFGETLNGRAFLQDNVQTRDFNQSRPRSLSHLHGCFYAETPLFLMLKDLQSLDPAGQLANSLQDVLQDMVNLAPKNIAGKPHSLFRLVNLLYEPQVDDNCIFACTSRTTRDILLREKKPSFLAIWHTSVFESEDSTFLLQRFKQSGKVSLILTTQKKTSERFGWVYFPHFANEVRSQKSQVLARDIDVLGIIRNETKDLLQSTFSMLEAKNLKVKLYSQEEISYSGLSQLLQTSKVFVDLHTSQELRHQDMGFWGLKAMYNKACVVCEPNVYDQDLKDCVYAAKAASPDEIVAAVQDVLSRPYQRQSLTNKAHNVVLKNHTSRSRAQKLIMESLRS